MGTECFLNLFLEVSHIIIPIFFYNLNSNCSDLYDMRNLQEQVKKVFFYQKLFWPFTAWINCSSDLKTFANSWPSASNFKSFSILLEQFFLTVGQNNFGNKISFLWIRGGHTNISPHCVSPILSLHCNICQPQFVCPLLSLAIRVGQIGRDKLDNYKKKCSTLGWQNFSENWISG